MTNVYALSTRESFHPRLYDLGVKESFNIDDLRQVSNRIGGFDVVIDPFFDIYFTKISHFINHFGRYTSCGIFKQHPDFEKHF